MLTSNRMNHSVLTLWHAHCTRTAYPQFLEWGFSPKVRIKLVAARLLFQVEQVRCWKDCEAAAMHVALCHCERCDSLKSLNSLAFSIWSLTSWIMYIIIIYSSHTGYTMKGALLSCCTTIPCCTMQGGFHLAGCRVHSGSLHRKVQFVAAWKLVCESIQINPKIVQSKSWLQYSHTSCPSMVFHDSLWNLTGFKLVCPWQKISRRPCLKSCISSCNLGAQRATLIDSWSSTNTAHFSSIKAHEKTRQTVSAGTSQY